METKFYLCLYKVEFNFSLQPIKFGISKSDAKVYADDILKIVRENWEKKAIEYRLTRGQIEKMRPTFTVCY